MSLANKRSLLCNCKEFTGNLLKFCKNIFLNPSNQLQWKKFEVFAGQYLCNVNHESCIHSETCSQKLCSIILEKLKKNDKWNEEKTIIYIFHVISLIYLEQTSFHSNCILEIYFKRSTCDSTRQKIEAYRIFAALKGKTEYVKILVHLQLLPSLKSDLPPYIEFGIENILYELMWMMGYDFPDKYMKKEQIMNISIYVFFRVINEVSFKRIYLTLIAIQAVLIKLKKGYKAANEYIYCLRMYFSITRDPLLTINEMRIMLYICLLVLKKLYLFEPFSREFVKILPECSANLEPRSLTDLARCRIRKSLKNCNLPLPSSILKINLPQHLKDFVLGDVIQMSKKKGIINLGQVITKFELDELGLENSRS